MPLSNYDRYFGGAAGSAQEAHDAMVKEYGSKRGESIFYATIKKRQNAGEHLARAMSSKVRGHRHGRARRH